MLNTTKYSSSSPKAFKMCGGFQKALPYKIRAEKEEEGLHLPRFVWCGSLKIELATLSHFICENIIKKMLIDHHHYYYTINVYKKNFIKKRLEYR